MTYTHSHPENEIWVFMLYLRQEIIHDNSTSEFFVNLAYDGV